MGVQQIDAMQGPAGARGSATILDFSRINDFLGSLQRLRLVLLVKRLLVRLMRRLMHCGLLGKRAATREGH